MKKCPYCHMAKSLLKQKSLRFKYRTKSNTPELMKITNNYPFFPKIFFNGRFIGGYAELKTHLEKIRRSRGTARLRR